MSFLKIKPIRFLCQKAITINVTFENVFIFLYFYFLNKLPCYHISRKLIYQCLYVFFILCKFCYERCLENIYSVHHMNYSMCDKFIKCISLFMLYSYYNMLVLFNPLLRTSFMSNFYLVQARSGKLYKEIISSVHWLIENNIYFLYLQHERG